jgi:hypothetical protein
VQRIVDRFKSLNPYDRKLVPGSILKNHKLNWDHNKHRRQLFGYSIAAKRYALYTKTHNDIEIVEPKAHGLGYFYPPMDSPEGWNQDVPQWIFETWDWIMRGVLGLKRTKPTWFDLPVMMKLTLSTPHHALQYLAKGPLTRPNNFMMLPQICRFGCPQGVDPNKFTLITPFSSDRAQWMRSKCVNIHDSQSPIYQLANEYDGRRVLPKNFFMLLDSYQNPPGSEEPRAGREGVRIRHARTVATGAHRRELATDLHRQRVRQALGRGRRLESAGIQSDRVPAQRTRCCRRQTIGVDREGS